MNLHARIIRRIALALAAVAACAASSAACPQSCVHIEWLPDVCTTAAQMDTTGRPNSNSVAQGGFNIPLGTLYALGHSGMDGCEPRTTVEDDFNVVGLPVGTVVPMTARLSLVFRGSVFGGPEDAYASMLEGASNSSAVNWGRYFDGITRDTVLTLPVTAIVGTPFRMRYVVGLLVGELCSAEWHASFDFTGFPAGVTIVSCNGYALGATPTRTTTWGRLKARYR